MTIQLNTSASDTAESQHTIEVLIAIDLSSLGVNKDTSFEKNDLPAEHLNFPVLASACEAAVSGGIDAIALDRNFFAHSYTKNRHGNLDPAKVTGQLVERFTGGFSAEIPVSTFSFKKAIDYLACDGKGWGNIEVLLSHDSDLEMLQQCAERAHMCGLSVSVRSHADIFTDDMCKAVVTWADAVRLETPDPHIAREIRFALRSAANELGRSLKVFCELGILISASSQAAQERAWLITAIESSPVFKDKPHVIGTVYDVADEAERWISMGAADGIVFLPASIPTDLASLIRGVLPVLNARGSKDF